MAKNIIGVILIIYLLFIDGSFNSGVIKNDINVYNTEIIAESTFGDKLKDTWTDIKDFFKNIYCKVFDCDENDDINKIDTTTNTNEVVLNDTPSQDTIVSEEEIIPTNQVETEEYEEEEIVDNEPVMDPYVVFRNKIQTTYISQIGVRERTNHNDGYMVEQYLASAGLSKGNPWCASFVYWTFLQNGASLKVSGKGWVPSYFPPSKTIYVRGKYSKMDPKYGDLIGIWFEDKGRLAHIGFYDSEDDKYYYSVEGNTNDAGSREGDGVYRKKRIKRQVHSISNWID